MGTQDSLGVPASPSRDPLQPAVSATPANAERPQPGVGRLWDSQWVNIVNAPEVLGAGDAREAVHIAVKLTEARMAANFAEAKAAETDYRAIARVQSAKLHVAMERPGAAERLRAVMESPDWRPNPEELEAAQTAAYAEGRKDEQAELASVLPGTYYMDPPDGGSVEVLEQFRRMARDAARYRWLRGSGHAELYVWAPGADPCKGIADEGLDAAVDAALKEEA